MQYYTFLCLRCRTRWNTALHIHVSLAAKLSAGFIKQAVFNCPKLLQGNSDDNTTPLHITAKHGRAHAAEELIKQAEALHDGIDTESGKWR